MKGEGKEDEQSRSHSGSVVVVPAAVLFQPLEMIEWEEGPDKGTDQKTSTPCWKRRRGGWLNSPLLLSKLIEGNIIGDSDKAVIAIQEWCPADQGKEWRQLLKGEGEEENWRLVDPFDLLMGKDKYESIGQDGNNVNQGWKKGPAGMRVAESKPVHWDKYGQGVGLSEKKEPLCERVRSKEEENKKAKEWDTVSMETTERLKRKPICRGRGIKVDVPVEAQSDLNQGIIVGEDFKDSFHLLGNLLVIYFCNRFKS
ncbi:hypothetical protein PPACK8108_LOCUS9830 [Phakopsora pachyrhizi]|uniref:Uncharacterized protein n=1 Tax=Phakopsora pachyrhizi TaxID=170000 RepID=A0AAV0AZ78_PHAPC|nr:hypothetical protein PPACK8108_LOCUS9830 [Phakopsora pachyrhizi]